MTPTATLWLIAAAGAAVWLAVEVLERHERQCAEREREARRDTPPVYVTATGWPVLLIECGPPETDRPEARKRRPPRKVLVPWPVEEIVRHIGHWRHCSPSSPKRQAYEYLRKQAKKPDTPTGKSWADRMRK